MILFPTAKINLGLRVTEKRTDGFHNIESIFYPVPLCDVIEFREASSFQLTVFGKDIPGKSGENLLVKTWQLLQTHFSISPIEVNLLKNIPIGSGLGGGSADATFLLRALNRFFQLNITNKDMLHFATQLGSDCPFFILNKPAFVTGKGDIVQPCHLDLSGYTLIIVVPERPLSTASLFSKTTPVKRENTLREALKLPIKAWQQFLTNDFEKIVFQEYPVLGRIKASLYHQHALYASITGTGSAVYGLFETSPDTEALKKYGTIYGYRL